MRTRQERDATEDSACPPEGWEIRAIADVCVINPPKPPVGALPPSAYVTFVPMPAVDAAAGAITSPERRTFSEVRNGHTAFQDGDVIFAKITPCMENGKAAVARGLENGIGFGSTEFHVLRPNQEANPNFLYYFIRQESFRKAAQEEMTGSVGQKRVPVGFVKTSSIPLPPLPEQHRIVARVEELLASVSVSRERLARVITIIDRFRQSVLSAACSGRLTINWREEHPDVESPANLLDRIRSRRPTQLPLWANDETDDALPDIPDTWEWIPFGSLAESIRTGSTEVPQEQPTDFPILRSSSVRPGIVDFADVRFLSAEQSRKPENYISERDMLFTRLSGSLEFVANCALVQELDGRRIQYPDRLFCAKIIEPDCAKYCEMCFRSPVLRKFITVESKSSAGHQRISTGAVTRFPIPFPSVEEQCEIVRRVESLFKLADDIETRVAAAALRAEQLTQAILAKAFRGELVATEAELSRREGREYEPASELLARINRER